MLLDRIVSMFWEMVVCFTEVRQCVESQEWHATTLKKGAHDAKTKAVIEMGEQDRTAF